MLFTNFWKKIRVQKFIGVSESNTPLLALEKEIPGIRLKGHVKVKTTDDGDEVTCDIQYKTAEYIPPHSLIEDREVIDCEEAPALMKFTGYISYVK